MLLDQLEEQDWKYLYTIDPNEGAQCLTDTILRMAKDCIGQRTLKEIKSNHPWMTEEIVSLVAAKKEAMGTPQEKETAEHCSRVITSTRE